MLSGESCTYIYTSVGPAEETLTVPAGVNMTVTAYGAPGGRGEENSGALDGTPGGGGMEQGTFNFPIDETLTILVGEAGGQASAAGEGGGGAGDSAFFGELYQGGKGGGGSYVFAGNSPLVIAGGGGGTGSDNTLGNQVGGAGGGAAGGSAGQAGLTSTAPAPENQGGAGGNPGTSSGGGLGGAAGAPPTGGTPPQSGQNGKGPVTGPTDPNITDGGGGLDSIGGTGGGGGIPGTSDNLGMAGGGGGGYTGGGGGGDSADGGGGAGGGGSGYIASIGLVAGSASAGQGVWFSNTGEVVVTLSTAAPTISWQAAPQSQWPSTELDYSGANWTPNSPVSVTFTDVNNTSDTVTQTVQADASGNISGSWTPANRICQVQITAVQGSASAIPSSPPDDGTPAGQVLHSEGTPNIGGGPTLKAGAQICSSDLPLTPVIHSGDVLIAALGTGTAGIENYQIYDQQTAGVTVEGETVLHVGANICFDTAAGGSVTANATTNSATATTSSSPCPVAQEGTGIETALSDQLAYVKSITGYQTISPGGLANGGGLAGFVYDPGPETINGNLNLNGASLYVGGDVQINGTLSGSDALYVNGTLVLNGRSASPPTQPP